MSCNVFLSLWNRDFQHINCHFITVEERLANGQFRSVCYSLSYPFVTSFDVSYKCVICLITRRNVIIVPLSARMCVAVFLSELNTGYEIKAGSRNKRHTLIAFVSC